MMDMQIGVAFWVLAAITVFMMLAFIFRHQDA
jgi:hypothetical protein